MATRKFADLSTYRRALDSAQGTSDILNSLLQGAQQGIQLQQLPGKLQEQQLAQQIQNAINIQKLQDIQNPDAALARQVQRELTLKGALNPELGITRAPAGLVGETIFQPGAITAEQQASLPSPELLAMRDVALNQAGVTSPAVVIPTAPAAGVAETPISLGRYQTGLNINPNIPEQAQEDKLNRQIQLANARARTAGLRGKFIDDGRGGLIWAQEPTATGEKIKTTRVETPEGEAVKVAPKGIKNILALNEKTGRVTNIALNPGEEIPEGFKQVTKGASSTSDFKNVQALRKEVSANPVVKQFSDVSKSKQRIDDAMKEASTTNNFTVVDQALISSFNRLLEPDSVTMVSEYARTSADAPLINRIKANINRITEGGRLSAEEREVLSRLSNRIYQTSLGNYSKTVDWYENIAEKSGFDPADVIQPLSIENPPPTTVIPTPVGKIKLIAPDGAEGFWDASKPIPQGYKQAQ